MTIVSSNFCTSTMSRSNHDSSDSQTISSYSNGLEIVSEWDWEGGLEGDVLEPELVPDCGGLVCERDLL